MKVKEIFSGYWQAGLLAALCLAVYGLTGCSTDKALDIPPPATEMTNQVPRLHVDDTVTITLTGIPDQILPMEKPIKEDGTISLPDVGDVQAAGVTPGELENRIHDLYVPKVYTHLNVTVKTTSDRVYFVRGEVKTPGRIIYVGPITVTKAITSAGDFTDFANHREVYLIREGKRYRLNCNKILHGDMPDPEVYPGDQIEVLRSAF